MMTFEESMINEYIGKTIQTKDELLSMIDKKREVYKNIIADVAAGNKGYYESLNALFEKLYEQIDNSELFDAPEGMWHYVILYNCYGIRVVLQKEEFCDKYPFCDEDFETEYATWNRFLSNLETIDSYQMFNVAARLLTVEEYAQRYGVKVVTVRQWIRRGKIRSALKYGSEWRIPELAPTPNSERGYKTAYYSWEDELKDLPDGFDFINKYKRVTICTTNDKKNYEVDFNAFGVPEYGILLDESRKEKLELYLISNPNVKNIDTSYAVEYKF